MPPPSMLMPRPTINYDTYVEETRQMMAAARDEEAQQTFESEVGETEAGSSFGAGLWGWTKRLPRNISVGAARAAVNTFDAMQDLSELVTPQGKLLASARDALDPIEGNLPASVNIALDPKTALVPFNNFLDEVSSNNTVSDDITQGVMQFAIPFTGYLKALGGVDKTMKLLSVGRLALAEGVTAASAFEAHEGRVADLAEMGRQMDNEFGRVLQRVSPNGSLLNSYINWIIDRENEGEWEGRFKNAVDSVVTTGGLAGFLKGAAVGLRNAKRMIGEFGTMTPRELQRGSIGVTDEALSQADVRFELGESVATVTGRGTTIQVKRPDGTTVGHMEVAQRGGDALQVLDVRLDQELRGRGLSTELYLDAIQNAQARGFKNFTSDTEVSLQAVNSWDALERRGFKIDRNPNVETTTVERGGERRQVLQSTDNRPIFSVSLEDTDKLLGERQMRSTILTETQ